MSLLGIKTKVQGVTKDDSGKLDAPSTTVRANNTAYTAGQRVVPATANGHIYKCLTAGTSGSSAPTFPLTPNATVADGTVTWIEEPDSVNSAINTAIAIYSKHRPAESVKAVTGNAGHDYDAPSGWVDEFSRIIRIEYPVDEVPAEYLDEDDFTIYSGPSGKKIRLIADTPAATEAFNITFTIPRTEATIPAPDEDAVANLAAAICLEMLANAFTQTSDSTIGADAVNYRSKGYEFGQRAKALRKLYSEHMGIKEDDIVPAAIAVRDMDGMNYPGGSGRLTHSRRARERR